jgi:hypothetical protein
MKTYPIIDEASGRSFAFEVENAYVSSSALGRLLTGIDGVTSVRKRKAFRRPDDVHIEFEYLGREHVVWEPFGDNSRYWIGPKETKGHATNIQPIEERFKSYRPPLARQLLGDILSFRFKRSSRERRP